MLPLVIFVAATLLIGCADLLGIDDWDPASGGAGSSMGQGAAGAGTSAVGGASTGPTTTSSSSGAGGSAYAAEVLADSPIEYWPLDEMAGPTAASVAGDRTDGTYIGQPVFGRAPLVTGSASSVRFNQMTDMVSVGDVHDFAPTQAFTLEAWVSLEPMSTDFRTAVIKLTSEAQSNGYILYINNDDERPHMRRNVAGNASDPVGPVLRPGVPYHLVATYDGTETCLYVNVKPICSTDANQIPDTLAPLALGAYLNGDLDEVALYDHPLDPGRIAAHYAAGSK